ncbi:MAG: cytochrome c [Acidobacteria bacterium]|nr:cytochrome c [Acidobacteriota bacterium]
MFSRATGTTPYQLPALMLMGVITLALTLLTIGARSPYTQANLDLGYDPNYTRTEQTLIGPPIPYRGANLAVPPAADPVEQGRQLFVIKGCASCHGLAGRDGIIAPVIVGTDADTLRKKTSKGPGGMPAYAHGALSDEDLAAIAAYLKAIGKP